MAKTDISSTPQKMFKLLKDFTAEERQRVITATLTLFGEAPVSNSGNSGGNGGNVVGATPLFRGSGTGGGSLTARQFFEQKKPKGKSEELAVAVHYLENQNGTQPITKDQIEAVVTAAKRNFDSKNFSRDLDNAKNAKLFNAGKQIQLSHIGDSYVDALPDREAAAAVKKSVRKGGKRGRKKTSKRNS